MIVAFDMFPHLFSRINAGSVTGLFYGDPGQFVAQVIGAVTCFVYVWGLSYAFFKIVDKVIEYERIHSPFP